VEDVVDTSFVVRSLAVRSLAVRSLVVRLLSRPAAAVEVSVLEALEKLVHSGRSRRNDEISPVLLGRDADLSLWVGLLRRRVARFSWRRCDDVPRRRRASVMRGIGAENERGSALSEAARRAVATNGNEA
jgi:hypothetical protein